jgi:hypothetical protein
MAFKSGGLGSFSAAHRQLPSGRFGAFSESHNLAPSVRYPEVGCLSHDKFTLPPDTTNLRKSPGQAH